jgi:hypothetical protein
MLWNMKRWKKNETITFINWRISFIINSILHNFKFISK